MPYADPVKNRECVRKYRLEHRDELNTKKREWLRLNPKKSKEYTRRYKSKLPVEVYKKRKHESYLRRKEKHLNEGKAWRLKHPDKAKKYHANWLAKNPARCSHHRAIRRARIFRSTIGNLDVIEKWEKKWKSEKTVKCYWCCQYYPPTKCATDHIVSLSRNGSHSIENLCISCRLCNAKKHARSTQVWNSELESPSLL